MRHGAVTTNHTECTPLHVTLRADLKDAVEVSEDLAFFEGQEMCTEDIMRISSSG